MINQEEVYKNLKANYDEKRIDEIPKILSNIDTNQQKYNLKNQLNKLQDICNELYYVYGAEDAIILYQALINSIRHKYDIVDNQEIIHKFDDGEFVQ